MTRKNETRNQCVRRRRKALFEQQNGKCYWCGRSMIYLDVIPSGKVNGLMLTLDHLRDRYHAGRREEPQIGEQRYVAACLDCNNGRSMKATSEIPIEEIWERSGSYPSPLRCAGLCEPDEIERSRQKFIDGWYLLKWDLEIRIDSYL